MRQLYSNCHIMEATRTGFPMESIPKHHNCIHKRMSTCLALLQHRQQPEKRLFYVNIAIHFNEEWDLQVQPEHGLFNMKDPQGNRNGTWCISDVSQKVLLVKKTTKCQHPSHHHVFPPLLLWGLHP